MYIAILTNPTLISQKEDYDHQIEAQKNDATELHEDDLEALMQKSPLTLIKQAFISYDNQTEFLPSDENLYNLLQLGKFDLIINTAGKKTTGNQPVQHIGMLDLTKIPYSGSRMATIGLCKDKFLFKSLLRLNYIATAPFQKLKIFRGNIPKINPNLKFPLVVKFFYEGIHETQIPDQLVEKMDDLLKILENFAKKHVFSYVLIEEFIPGKKYYLPLLGNDINNNIRYLPMMEYDYPSVTTPKENIGAELPKPNISFLERTNPFVKRARDVAKKAYTFFNCCDYAMAVFLQDERNENLLLHELNPLTSLLPSGKLAMAADHIGESYTDLINEISFYTMLRYNMKIRGKYNKKFKDITRE